jgi:hypothetical protein
VDWFAVRCIFEFAEGVFEERLTIWQASGFDDAIARAEREAASYSVESGVRYLELAQAFKLADHLGEGAEVFSLLRDSDLAPQAYLARFFDTGTERQQT